MATSGYRVHASLIVAVCIAASILSTAPSATAAKKKVKCAGLAATIVGTGGRDVLIG